LASSIYDVFSDHHREGTHPINLTLGNPHLKPPKLYYQAMAEVLRELQDEAGNGHGYSTQKDPFGLCHGLASDLAAHYQAAFRKTDILVTVGATGALDVILKTLVRPAIDVLRPSATRREPDEILIIAPYFVEYWNLVHGNGARPVIVPSAHDFGLDNEAIAKAITPRTRAIIVNSPNNPTGKIYPNESLRELAQILDEKNRKIGHRIAVIEDAVYESIVFGDAPPPSMIPHYQTLFRVNSYSKSLSLSGERLGYLAVHPEFAPTPEREELDRALNLNMRARVVHAPLLQHRVVARLPLRGLTDVGAYRKNVECLHRTLAALGFVVARPEGTFYIWAALPDGFRSEAEFRLGALEGPSPLLYLPGVLFGGDRYDRYVRFSVCVPYPEVERACLRLREIVATSAVNPNVRR
jgi:aspartate aminotransferase